MQVNVELILHELSILPEYDTQISLQTVANCTDHMYGTGRLDGLEHAEKDFIHPLWNMPYTNRILKELGMYRTRVMDMRPKTCYTYHRDPSPRLHIPLVTNDSCFFVVDDEVMYLPADGNTYVIDTTKKHTFVNASRERRIHIVGCV